MSFVCLLPTENTVWLSTALVSGKEPQVKRGRRKCGISRSLAYERRNFSVGRDEEFGVDSKVSFRSLYMIFLFLLVRGWRRRGWCEDRMKRRRRSGRRTKGPAKEGGQESK